MRKLDALLAKAKAAGVTPIAQFNGGETGGLLFPLQDLMGAYGSPAPINNWIFQKPGATIDTPSNLKAVQHLQQWIQAGYFNSDANATDYFSMMSKFQHSEGLLIFDGDWESGNLDKQMPANVGFFLMPPATAGRKARRDVGAADLRDRCQGEARQLCSLLPELGRDESEGAQDRRHRRRFQPGRAPEPCRFRR